MMPAVHGAASSSYHLLQHEMHMMDRTLRTMMTGA